MPVRLYREFEVAHGHALTMETRVLALTVVDRESILRALDEPPTQKPRATCNEGVHRLGSLA